jgi:hypothetical protein
MTTATDAAPALPLTTADVARRLGVTRDALTAMIRAGRIPPPPRDSSGRFCWTDQLADLAREALGRDRRR